MTKQTPKPKPPVKMLSARGLFDWHAYHDTLLYWRDHWVGPSWRNDRQREIKECKPKLEQPLRLRLFHPVRGKLPAELVRLAREQNKGFDSDRDDRLVYLAKRKFKEEIEALHAIECPNCPWNGRTIFPRKPKRKT